MMKHNRIVEIANEALDNIVRAKQVRSSLEDDIYKSYAEAKIAHDLRSLSDVSIEPHPDYEDIEPGQNVPGNISNWVLDFRGMTNRILVEDDLVSIVEMLDSLILAGVDVVRESGGHLYNIPGDGVLAFFGGNDVNDTLESRRMAIGSAIIINYMIEEIINPKLDNMGIKPANPKVVIDYGKVIWRIFGDNSVVNAVGVPTFICSKIEKKTKSWEVRIGEGFKNKTDVEDYLSDSQEILKQHDNVSKSYRHYLFDWRKYGEDTGVIGANKNLSPIKAGIELKRRNPIIVTSSGILSTAGAGRNTSIPTSHGGRIEPLSNKSIGGESSTSNLRIVDNYLDEAMLYFPQFRRIETKFGIAGIEGKMTNNFHNTKLIRMVLPHGFPKRMPRLYCLDYKGVRAKPIHLYADGSLCLFWNEETEWSLRITASQLIAWAAIWLFCQDYYQWKKQWPAPESPHRRKGRKRRTSYWQ